MSHNINFNKLKGSYSFASANQPAWHLLGQIIDGAMTAEQAMNEANLAFTVKLAPLYAKFNDNKNDPDRGKQVKDRFATYREDTRDILGVVGSRYEVVQNASAFSFFDSIVGSGKAIYETAGALGLGETVFVTAKLPDYIVLPGEDLIEKYLLFTMGHDGNTPITAMFTPTRVVCANTLAIALSKGSNKVVIRHTASAHDKINEAAKLMGLVNKKTQETKEILEALVKKNITKEQVVNYVNYVFLTDSELENLAKTGSHKEAGVSERRVKIIDYVTDYVDTGVGQNTIATRGTLFGAYSGITSYFQNGKDYKNDEVKMKSLIMEGIDYKLSQRAFDIAKELITVW